MRFNDFCWFSLKRRRVCFPWYVVDKIGRRRFITRVRVCVVIVSQKICLSRQIKFHFLWNDAWFVSVRNSISIFHRIIKSNEISLAQRKQHLLSLSKHRIFLDSLYFSTFHFTKTISNRGRHYPLYQTLYARTWKLFHEFFSQAEKLYLSWEEKQNHRRRSRAGNIWSLTPQTCFLPLALPHHSQWAVFLRGQVFHSDTTSSVPWNFNFHFLSRNKNDWK